MEPISELSLFSPANFFLDDDEWALCLRDFTEVEEREDDDLLLPWKKLDEFTLSSEGFERSERKELDVSVGREKVSSVNVEEFW